MKRALSMAIWLLQMLLFVVRWPGVLARLLPTRHPAVGAPASPAARV